MSSDAVRRTIGNQISTDLNRLVNPTKNTKLLPSVAKRGPLLPQTGVGTYDAKNAPSLGGGIASPLNEQDASKRVYWDTPLLSSDGLFSIPAIKQLLLLDADGASVVINLAAPTSPASP